MLLSKREKNIAILTAIILLLFGFDLYVWTPAMNARARVQSEKHDLLMRLQQADRIFRRRAQVSQKWEKMKKGGLGSDASATESRVLNAVRRWSVDCGLPLSTVKPDLGKGKGNMREILFNLALTGDMNAVGRFLLQIETTRLPLRIKEFQLGSRGGNGQDLSLQLKLSALYLSSGADGGNHQAEEAE